MRLALMWTIQAQFAGYALARAAVPSLELVPRRLDTTPLDELLAGRAEFCLASPAHLLAAGAAARATLLVALFQSVSPVVLVGSRRRGGSDLRAAAGARVGVWPGEELEIVAMCVAAGLQRSDVEFVFVDEGFDEFLDGELGFLQATTYNELPALRQLVADPSDLIVHQPSQWGVDVAKDGLVTSRNLLGEDLELIDAVVRACILGWREARRDPKAAVAAVCALDPTLDEEAQRGQLECVLELFDPNVPMGQPRAAEVERAARVHQLAGHVVDRGDVRIDDGPWQRAASA